MRLKNTFLTFSLLLLTNLLTAQSINSEQIFSNTQGIKQTKTTFYQVEGYSIFVDTIDSGLDEKGLKKIKKKYSAKTVFMPTADSTLTIQNKVFTVIDTSMKDAVRSSIYYLIPNSENETKVITLYTAIKRDTALERFFVKSIISNTIPQEIYIQQVIDSIKFAGRYIVLGPVCQWMNVHSVQCPNLGQINWAEFRQIEGAKEMLIAQQNITYDKKMMGKMQKEETIDVIFEGKETKALKRTYKIGVPQLLMGGSNILIIYYVAQEVRGKYVGCVLSHYSDEVNAKRKLPPLLSEVMKLKE